MTRSLSILAPAKLNLFLHVVGRFADGMHDLVSLVCFTDAGDRIVIEEAEVFSFHVNGPFASSLLQIAADDNLVVRAVRMMAERFDRDLNFSVTLEKNLPVSAGIGGGSSDAAAVIKGVLKWWDIHDYPADLGHELGSDVPVCLHGRPAIMRGRGEILSNTAPLPSLFCVLVNPLMACSTPHIFRAFRDLNSGFSDSAVLPAAFSDYQIFIDFLSQQKNDLLDAACSVVPDIQTVLDVLGDQGSDLVRMSGSGATCFGIFECEGKAAAVAERIKQAYPKWWSCSATLL